jgi:hypothetical protein
MSTALFALGQTVITRAACDVLHPQDVTTCLNRHQAGDWGELCEHDRKENELGVAQGFRLLSVYRDRSNTKFYIITEHDRSVTTVLLPQDY